MLLVSARKTSRLVFALVLILSVCGLNDTTFSYIGRVGVGYECVVQSHCGLCILFAGPGCD